MRRKRDAVVVDVVVVDVSRALYEIDAVDDDDPLESSIVEEDVASLADDDAREALARGAAEDGGERLGRAHLDEEPRGTAYAERAVVREGRALLQEDVPVRVEGARARATGIVEARRGFAVVHGRAPAVQGERGGDVGGRRALGRAFGGYPGEGVGRVGARARASPRSSIVGGNAAEAAERARPRTAANRRRGRDGAPRDGVDRAAARGRTGGESRRRRHRVARSSVRAPGGRETRFLPAETFDES